MGLLEDLAKRSYDPEALQENIYGPLRQTAENNLGFSMGANQYVQPPAPVAVQSPVQTGYLDLLARMNKLNEPEEPSGKPFYDWLGDFSDSLVAASQPPPAGSGRQAPNALFTLGMGASGATKGMKARRAAELAAKKAEMANINAEAGLYKLQADIKNSSRVGRFATPAEKKALGIPDSDTRPYQIDKNNKWAPVGTLAKPLTGTSTFQLPGEPPVTILNSDTKAIAEAISNGAVEVSKQAPVPQNRTRLTAENIDEKGQPWSGRISKQEFGSLARGQQAFWNPKDNKLDYSKVDMLPQGRELITTENINDPNKPWSGNINTQGWNNRTEGQEFYWNPETQKIDVEKTDQKVTPITAQNWSSIPNAADPATLAPGESQVQTSDGRIVSSSTKTQPEGNIVLTAGNIGDYPQHQAAFNATRPGETLTLDLGKNTTNKSGSPAKLITFQNEKGDNLQAVEGSAEYNKYVKDPNITMTGTPTNRAPVEYGGFLTEENTASGGKYEQLATVYQKYKDSQYDVSVSNTGNLTLSKNKPDPKSYSRPMTAEERLLPKYAEVLTELPFGAIPILTQDPNYPDHFSVEIKEPKANEFVSIRNQNSRAVRAYHPRDPRLAELLNSDQGWYPFKHVTDLVSKGDNYENLSAQANYQYGRSLIGELKDVISANRTNVGAVGNVRRTIQSVKGMLGDFAGAFPGVQKAFQESSQGEAFRQELELQRVLNQTSGGEFGIEPMVSEYFDEKLSGVPTIAGALVYAYATANKGTSGRITMADIDKAEEQIKAISYTSVDDVITSLNKVDRQLQFRIKSAEQIRGGNRPTGGITKQDTVDRISGRLIPGNMKVLKKQADGTYK